VKLPITPNFKKAGKVSVVLDVEGIGAMSTTGGGTMDMKKMPILKRARFFQDHCSKLVLRGRECRPTRLISARTADPGYLLSPEDSVRPQAGQCGCLREAFRKTDQGARELVSEFRF
jgi:hypothetical protein